VKGGRKYGFEFKYADLPGLEKSMKIVQEDLKLTELRVIYPGARRFPLAPGIETLPLNNLKDDLEILTRR
jgi:predicted AAA+ superfamily ATPase